MSGNSDAPPLGGGDGTLRASPTGGSPTNTTPTNKDFLSVPGSKSRGNSLEQAGSDGGDTLVPTPATSHSDEDPLHPDPGHEAEFHVTNNPFSFSPGQLSKLFNPKSLAALKALGGLEGLEKGLRTNMKAGLSLDEKNLEGVVSFQDATGEIRVEPDFSAAAAEAKGPAHDHKPKPRDGLYEDRMRVFSDNRLPEKESKSLWRFMWIALMDKVLLLLSGAAAISLALGLYQTFGVKKTPEQILEEGNAKVEWVEGVAIMVAILIVVVVGGANDYQKERQFVKLNKKKEDRTVKVIRSGKTMEVSIYDLLVGDVCHMEPGDLLPADGIFISGHNVKCDESSATGESDQMKKISAYEAMNQWDAGSPGAHKLDPFIVSGGKVLEGVGTYVVTSTGVHSSFGKIMMGLREESTATPLQRKLNDLAEAIAKLGGASALLLFIVLLIRFLVQLRNNPDTPDEKGQNFMRILITAITVVVVAVPEGLPLAVTLALAFATTRMLKDNNLVRVLQACETMGNATTICSDKTGTLTQNRMTIVAGTLGSTHRFGDKKAGEKAFVPPPPTEDVSVDKEKLEPVEDAQTVAARAFTATLSSDLKELLLQSIAQNSTAFEGEIDGKPGFIGSKTETALLEFARNYLGMGPVSEVRSNATIAQLIPFDSGRKCMGVVVKLPSGQYRMYIKGASEIVLQECTRIVDANEEKLTERTLTHEVRDEIKQTITAYAERSLRTIGLLYRDFPSWPPPGARLMEDDNTMARFDDVFDEMIWLGIVGIMDPLRDGVPEAVHDCQKAGVFVRMVTGDNIVTAKAIATECGIYMQGGVVMEGPTFRKLSSAQMDQVIPRLQVLARSSPEDKRILVKRLKDLGETVAVTGDGTNDGPALKMADVGFSMGIAGTEVAKEASSIILMDDNFRSIVKALMWGRAVNDAVKKFLQFQLTVNITAVLLTFVSAVASSDETAVLSAVQLLWVNLIMDTFAALALATDPPAKSVLDRKPDPKSAPLITINMWKMILGQAIYQLVVTFLLHFGGISILGEDLLGDNKDDNGNPKPKEMHDNLKALVFNVFVWMQIFNQYNNRRLDNKFNIFEGISKNWFFIGVNVVMVGGQIMIIFVGGKAFSVVPLSGPLWAISICLGALSLPIAVIIRLIPDELVARILPKWMSRKRVSNVYVSNEDRFQWNRGIEDIREELSFIKMVRGGRLNQLKFKSKDIKETMKHNLSNMFGGSSNTDVPGGILAPPSPTHSRRKRSNSVFAAAAMVPSIVAGSVGAGGWSPVEKQEGLPFANKSEVEEMPGVTVHPDTANNDALVAEQPPSPGSTPIQNRDLAPPKQ